MRLTFKTGLRRSTAAALTAVGMASAAVVAAPATASAATPVSAHDAHVAHLAHLHHLHVLHVAHLNAQARAAADTASRSTERAPLAQAAPSVEAAPSLQAAPSFPTAPTAVRELARTMVPADQWASFDSIIKHESDWDVHAVNASSGAYGLCQALPGTKMASAGADWRDNPATQIKWALSYMNDRYGSPNAAWAFWQTHHWY